MPTLGTPCDRIVTRRPVPPVLWLLTAFACVVGCRQTPPAGLAVPVTERAVTSDSATSDPSITESSVPSHAATHTKNILFLFADDQRRDTIHAYGNRLIETPALDALAARGFNFRTNYCMGSIHGAVCQPSRAMLLTGRSLYHVKMNLDGTVTLPELLRDQGYTTFMTGKWHNGPKALERCFDSGANLFVGGMCDHTRVPVRALSNGHLTKAETAQAFSSELFADAVIAFLEQHRATDTASPFFAYVAFTAPHDPRQPPGPYRERYADERPPLPANFLPQHPFDNGRLTVRDEQLAPWPRTEDVIRDQLAEYYGMITHLDTQIARILQALDRLDLIDDTIIVYAADHGLAMGSHGLLGKQNLYEHSMGCPLIIAGPGIEHGETHAMTYLLDILPTLCEMTNTPVPDGVDGKSLGPLITGSRAQVRDQLFLTYENKIRALRDARFKLIRYPLVDVTQLFDLESDPYEMKNLADDPSYRDRVASLTASLEEWRLRTDDPHPYTVAEPRDPEIDLTGRARKPDRWQPAWIREKYFHQDLRHNRPR